MVWKRAGLLVLLAAVAANAQFMGKTPMRRRLHQAAPAPSVPLNPIYCPEPDYLSTAPSSNAIFDQLSPLEYMDVAVHLVNEYSYLFPAYLNQTNPVPNVNELYTFNTSNPYDGTIGYDEDIVYNIFLTPPNKAEALAYLDSNGPKPGRYATAIVIRGSVKDVIEYNVGPLPVGPKTMVEEVRTVIWNKRPQSGGENMALAPLLAATNTELTPFFLEVTGECLDSNNPACANTSIAQWSQASWVRENGTNRHVVFWHWLEPSFGGSGDELFAIPFYFKLDMSDPDPSQWYVYDFEHCTQYYETLDEFMAAFNSSSMKICSTKLWIEPAYVSTWANDVPQTKLYRTGSTIPGPRLYEPAGKRFQVLQADSPTSRSVEWMGWDFHVTVEPWRGMRFHNINFMGQRVMYELSWMDQFVAYTGIQSVGSSYYYDATFSLGGEEYTLRPGYDCPETATYMDINVMGQFGQIYTYKAGVCIFEQYTGDTTWRHFDYEDDYVDSASRDRGVRQYELIVRTVATVGNYDYMATVHFNLDGEVDVQVYMAGYMQNTYFDDQWNLTAKDQMFGTRAHQKSLANIHDHLSSWKVDLDVLGTTNSLHKTVIRAGTYEQIFPGFEAPAYASPSAVYKYADSSTVQTEAGYQLNFSEPTLFLIANDAKPNQWGNSPSYGIFHGYTAPQLLPADHPLVQAAAWSKYNIAVTVRKENESVSSMDYYDFHNPVIPVLDFDSYLDGESIVGQDLVAWVSMGIIHVPRGEDIPLISNVGSSFAIKPVNYFTELPTLNVADSDDFEACTPKQGNGLFDYTWSASGSNRQYNKAGFTLAQPLPETPPVAVAG